MPTLYKLPDEIDGHPLLDICLQIPDNREYRAAFLGALQSVCDWKRWERDSERKGTLAANVMRDAIFNSLSMGCEMQTLIREAPGCGFEYSLDGGENWFLVDVDCLGNAGAPLNINIVIGINSSTLYQYIQEYNVSSTSIFAEYNAASGCDKAGAICYAADYFVASWCQLKVAELDRVLVSGAIGLALFAILTGGLGLLFGLVTGGIALAGYTLVVARAALTDSRAQHIVACDLATEINSRAISQANWRVAWQNLQSSYYDTGSNEQIIADLMAAVFDVIDASGRVGQRVLLDAAARACFAGWDDCACPVCDVLQSTWDADDLASGLWRVYAGTWDTASNANARTQDGVLIGAAFTNPNGLPGLELEFGAEMDCVPTEIRFWFKSEHPNPNNVIEMKIDLLSEWQSRDTIGYDTYVLESLSVTEQLSTGQYEEYVYYPPITQGVNAVNIRLAWATGAQGTKFLYADDLLIR